MSDTKKIEDFGEKIGGARKDLWKSRNLELSDVADWTAVEREKYITKKQVWKAPDYQKLCDDGLSRRLAFFIKLIHDNLPAAPQKNTQEYQDGYIEFVSDVRDRAMQLETDDDIDGFLTSIINDYYLNGINSYGCLTSKFMRTPDTNYQLDRKIREKQFLYTDEEKALSKYAFFEYDGNNIDFDKNMLVLKKGSSKYYSYRNDEKLYDKNNWQAHTYCVVETNNHIVENNFENLEAAKKFAVEREKTLHQTLENAEKKTRKKRFIPQQLAHIERTGEDCRMGKNISGNDMLNTFGFYGGEFGNWENQNERQQNLNFSYEAFKDLAHALDVNDSDISLDGKLSIAYGARGIGNALAHFEPERNVINLTKMKGAGSLAHEWGHALDFFLASKLNLNTHYATESCHELIKPVINAIKWKSENGTFTKTDYYKNSGKMDKLYTKSDKGYWSSETEMFARAFACYIADKLAPEKSDYLCGHSETAVGIEADVNPICAFPLGVEREAINAAFDELIKTLKEREILHENKQEMNIENRAAEVEKRNAERRENLLKIAEKIGYKRAVDRLEQGLYTSNLTPQEIDFRKNIIAEIQQKTDHKIDVPQQKNQTENIKNQPQKTNFHKSSEEIEQANYVNLPQFLTSQGFELKRVGKEYIMKDHDSVHITDNALGEKGKWFRFSQNKGGDNIAFVQEFMGKSFHEAVELLNGGRSVFQQHKAPVQEQKNHAEQEIHIQKNPDAKRALAYLSKTRGLDYEMVKNLAFRGDLIQEAKTGNAVFLIKNESGITVGAEKIGTSSERKFKGIAAGSTAERGFEMCYGKGENALFFESAIDMLSYAQLHKNDLDNHRLISMMGVKPSVVETAMRRYKIPPEKIFICSDNDAAGNDFAKKLQEKYPEIKRLTAESQYKDWNDQLRNIPMENHAENTLKTFGNPYWNKAVGNSEKVIFQMSEDTFFQCRNALENAALNYFAFAKNGIVNMAVQENETDIFRELIGQENAEKIHTRRAEKEYVPPEKNIVGNADIQDIMLKSEIEAETQAALKTAELLVREKIKFSVEISGDISTITVASADVEKAESLKKSVAEIRRQHFPEEVDQDKEISGNAPLDPETKKPDIADCYYFISRLSPQEYKEIQPVLESSEKARFSAVMRDEKLIFVVERSHAQDFVHEYNRVKNQNKIRRSLSGLGLNEKQIEAFSTSIEKAAESRLIGILDDYANKDYNPVQTTDMNALLTEYLSDRSNKNFTALLDAKSRMDKEIADGFDQEITKKSYAETVENTEKSINKKAVKNNIEKTGFSMSKLTVDDVILLPSERVLDRNFKPAVIPPTYAKVTAANETQISFDTYSDRSLQHKTGKAGYLHNWVEQLEKMGAEYLGKYSEIAVNAEISDQENTAEKLDAEKENIVIDNVKKPLISVDEIDKISALHDEIMRGSGFQNGKFRIAEFYSSNNPDNKTFADFLKKEYGIGGHSADDPIAYVNYDSKGIRFTLTDENGGFSEEKFSFKWSEVAEHTAEMISKSEYFTDKEREKYSELISEKIEKNTAEKAENPLEKTDLNGSVSEEKNVPNADYFISAAMSTLLNDRNFCEIISGSDKENAHLEIEKRTNNFLTDVMTGRVDTDFNFEMAAQFNNAFHSNENIRHDIYDRIESDIFKALEQLEKARNIADENGIPFSDNFINDTNDFEDNRYVFDGSMSLEDYNKRQLLIELSEITNTENGTPYRLIEDFEKTLDSDVKNALLDILNNDYTLTEKVFAAISESDYIKEKQPENIAENLEKAAENENNISEKSVKVPVENADKNTSDIEKNATDNIEKNTADSERNNSQKEEDTTEKSEEKSENTDFHITDDTLGEGGAKTRFKANIAAIETLKILEKEERPATAQEKEILSKYVGWGGLAQAFDSNNEKWSKEFSQLRTLLSDSEYRSAKASVLDSFYTPPVVIDSIYNAIEKFGFSGGNILEPSCGTGSFIGKMPEEVQQNSSVYGVEIDSISGRIAKQIYPNADIQVKGFEKTDFQNGCFDIAVGNVPFGDLGFVDKEYGTKQLHDFFFEKTLDKLKNGGIAAFVTSTGTLDKADEFIRKALSEKADLIGAIRLPSGTFAKNAGTEVDSDIIFLQKRSESPEHEPDWIHIGETENGLPINKYFEQNPDMVLGEMTEGNKLYGHGTICMPVEGADLKEQLENAVHKLSAKISDERAADVYPKVEGMTVIPPENLRNFSFFEQDNTIYFKTSDRICEARCNSTNKDFQAVKAFIGLRNTTRELLSAQEQNKPDPEIKSLQEKLNLQYDSFTKKFGLLHSKTNKNRFADDVSYNLTAALEKSFDLSKGIAEKADIFTKRTIKPPQAVDHADTAMEALTISLGEKACVDLDYMQTLTDMPKDELTAQLQGEIFPIPFAGKDEFQTAAEYLSGNIYQKLEIAENAAKSDIRFENNVRALKESIPPPLKAEDIEIQLGAAWIDPKVYQQFMYELLETADEKRADKLNQTIDNCREQLKSEPIYKRFSIQREIKKSESSLKNAVTIARSAVSGEWSITPKPTIYSNLTVHEQEYSTKRRSAYQIMEDLLNLREPKVYKTVVEQTPDGEKERRVLDDKATKAAHLKAEKIKSEFKDWLFKDPQRRNELVQQYNEKFNCIKPREYDGSNLTFPTMNSDIELRPHQKNAVAHAMFGGNTLFAHAVGAGKTFEMIAAAMESKRLGLCNKPMLCVPKQLTEQIGEDFRLLYPNANILVATAKDFEKNNRQQLFAKITAGDFDAVIVSHEQLGKIPISKERQVNLLENQLNDIVKGIAEAKQRDGSSVQVKALERSRKSVKKRLDTLLEKPQDNTVTFEEMGIDKLIVDEAHSFKNLFTPTRLQNVSGISTSASQKAEDLFMKCRYLDEKTGGKGVVFATGTPLSNSMTELHVMMRYLEYDFLKEMGVESFDNWVSVFGKQQTDWQLNTTGSDVKQKVHMSYTGIPELMSMFKQIADIRTAEMLDLDVPECEMHVVQTEPTEEQKDMLAELSNRADALQNRVVTDPRIDNPLKITGDGRKLALDPRLIDPTLEDNPNTKLNKCVENVFKIYEETAPDKLTQIIFCDLGVPSGAAKRTAESEEKSTAEQESLEEICDFCVYDDIRKKLIEKGVKPDEIAYIHNAKTEKDKENLFAKVRSGEVRVLLGSTSKMGTGVNVQKKLIAVHDLDIPWRPADMEQRRGRLVRQGNENKNVHQYRYVTKGTFDSYSYQLLESKQNFISQIMTSNAITRNADDIDQQALNYSEIKALCIGDERLKQRADMENEVANMRIQKREHDSRIYDMQDLIAQYPETKSRLENTLEALKTDKAHADKLPIYPENNRPFFSITIGGKKYSEKKPAAAALMETVMSQIDVKSEAKSIEIGEFMGFPLTVEINGEVNFGGEKSAFLTATLHGAAKHKCDFTESFDTNLRRLESTIAKIDKRIENTENALNGLEIDHENALKIVNEPFELKSRDGRSLPEMETALKDLTEELAKSAASAKRNAPDKPQTHYFSMAKFKKNAAQIKNQERKPKQSKSKSNELE